MRTLKIKINETERKLIEQALPAFADDCVRVGEINIEGDVVCCGPFDLFKLGKHVLVTDESRFTLNGLKSKALNEIRRRQSLCRTQRGKDAWNEYVSYFEDPQFGGFGSKQADRGTPVRQPLRKIPVKPSLRII